MKRVEDFRLVQGWFMGNAAFGGPLQIAHKRGGADPEVRHLHRRASEYFIVLAGSAVLEVDGREWPLGAGAVVLVEPGEPHLLKRKSPDLELLLLMDRYLAGDKQVLGGEPERAG